MSLRGPHARNDEKMTEVLTSVRHRGQILDDLKLLKSVGSFIFFHCRPLLFTILFLITMK